MASPYRYIRKLFGVGLGVEDLAFQPFQTLPLVDGTGGGQIIRGQLRSTAPGFVKMGQDFVAVDMIGNGLAFQGQMELQALSKLAGGENG